MNSAVPNPADFFTQKEINGKRYTINKLGGWDAYDGFTLIMKIVGPVFGEVLDSKNVDEEATMFDKQNTFREILTIVTMNLRDPEFKMLINRMLVGATVDGEPLNVDKEFQGNFENMLELIVYCVTENFSGLFTRNGTMQSLTEVLGKVMTQSNEL